jgi:hypothetical protein
MPVFAVTLERHGEWDFSRDLREQDGWDAHAAFMDTLVVEGFVQLGGPFADGVRVLLIVEAADRDEVGHRLAADPWYGSRLRIAAIEPWEILLRAPG